MKGTSLIQVDMYGTPIFVHDIIEKYITLDSKQKTIYQVPGPNTIYTYYSNNHVYPL